MTATKITRREILTLTLPLLAAVPGIGYAQESKTKPDQRSFASAPSAVVPATGYADDDIKQVSLVRQWRGQICQSQLVNRGKKPARVKEVVLFDLKLALPAVVERSRRDCFDGQSAAQ